MMGNLIEIITSGEPSVRDQSLDSYCNSITTEILMNECDKLDVFRRENSNLYFRVRALFFLYAIHRFHLPLREGISQKSLIPFKAYQYIMKRRFEEAIDIFLGIQKGNGLNEGISSGLAEAYRQLAFKTLTDQVRKSVHSSPGNQWMFSIENIDNHPLKISETLFVRNPKTGLYPVLNESTPVRIDITHSCWSDIFFLGMDFPDGAQVINISVNLQVRSSNKSSQPKPPIDTFFRLIDEPVIKLTSIDLNATASIKKLEDIFDFSKDYLGLLKASVIASGIVPPGFEGSGIPLHKLLEKIAGPGKGIELVSHVNNIPRGSRLAVSTNLLASLIAVCMRATGQTVTMTGVLNENERRLVASRAILGEWLAGSGGGWQDSGGIWPGIKIIKGVRATKGDPEFGISNGRLLPKHIILNHEDVSPETRKKLQDCLVLVHGGMAQDVGPVLEMVTEKYLLRSEKEWNARQQAIKYFDYVVNKLKVGDIRSIGNFTQMNFEGPIQTIIPWTSNLFTETIINKIKDEFGDNFWGFWMMGGMSGGGMGFLFNPDYKTEAQDKLQSIMTKTKKKLEHAIPFAMEPVIYDFSINETGSECKKLEPENEFFTIDDSNLMKSDNDKNSENQTLKELLNDLGFDTVVHQQIKSDLKSGNIGLSKNRLSLKCKVENVDNNDVSYIDKVTHEKYYEKGLKALKNQELGIITFAGGIGSRWTKGAGVVKSLYPFAKLSGKYRNFIEIHLAKNRRISYLVQQNIPHVFTTSYLTHDAIVNYLEQNNYYGNKDLYISPGRIVGLKLIPTIRELYYMWEIMTQQMLDEQAQKVRDGLYKSLVLWAKQNSEGEDYTDNLPHQCIHPVGHWYEFPNMLLNGTLRKILKEKPNLKYLLIHNIDTLGADAAPEVLGFHISTNASITAEVISRKLEDRGGSLAKIDGKIRLIEGFALPDEKMEFDLTYYNTNTFWVNIDKLLDSFGLSKEDLDNTEKIRVAVRNLSKKMPTYVTLKDVKKRWGKGHEDIFPVMQFEKLWGDMTTLRELNCNYLVVPRMRGQQLKDIAQLDGWLRDGSADYIEKLCEMSQ